MPRHKTRRATATEIDDGRGCIKWQGEWIAVRQVGHTFAVMADDGTWKPMGLLTRGLRVRRFATQQEAISS